MTLLTAALFVFFLLAAPQALAEHVSCGDLITESTTLDSDLLDCPGNGLVIGADGVDLDLAGHTVRGAGPAVDTGIVNDAGYDDVTVKDGAVHGFPVAVRLGECLDLGACDSGVRRNNLHHLTLSSEILVIGSQDNEITGNNFTCCTGIMLLSTSGNLIKRNSLASMYLFFADDNQIERNRISNGDIRIYAGERNMIEHNSIFDGYGGITFEGGDNNWIRRNHIANTELGIVVVGGSINSTRISGNHLANNSARGISIVGSDNTIEGNVVTGGGFDGIDVSGDLNRVERNRATENGDDGIEARSPGTILTGNRTSYNGDFGIEAVPGVIDGGRNRARGNGNPLQCLNVACK